jgi:TolB-like protein/DNA-binding winged helix-turn-helix (wHTH) protein
MAETTRVPGFVRFVPFEVSPDSGELRRNGVRLKLSGQAIQVLLILLDVPGQLVTREELQNKLWPGASFGDFDHGLNAAVNRLREVLGDSATQPKFIDTVPRRGYRFIATTNVEPQLPSPPVSSEVDVAVVEGKSSVVRSRVRTMIWLAAILVPLLLIVLLIGTNVGGWRDRPLTPGPKPKIRALAVLPLANLSADPSQEYFADAVTDALITEMGAATGPRVISRQSVMQYKNSKKSLQSIAAELNVDALLEGTVERSGERVRVTVHLDQTSPERQLWSKKYDRDVRDLLGVQDDIARSVVNELQLDVSPEQHARLSRARVVDPEAQDAYLRGVFSLIHGPIESQAAVDNFKHAIQKDPGYALAYSGLAQAYLELGAPAGDLPPNQTLPEAKAAARRAVELDPSLAQAHVTLGDTFSSEWNWVEAETEYQRALHLNPSDANAHVAYAGFLSAVGRHAEALPESKYAVELDPFNPGRHDDLGWVALRARQYDFAIEQLAGVEDNGLGWAYLCKKKYPEAIAAMERHGRYGRSPFYISSLAEFYGLAGRRREAQLLIAELKRIARHRYVSPGLFFDAYFGIGDKNQALTWLERGYEQHDEWMIWTKVWPLNDDLRSDPRFQALIRKMNYPQ